MMLEKNTFVPLCFALCLALLPACAGKPPDSLGVQDGRLAPCPDSPNCVSSMEEGERHVSALSFAGTPEKAMDCLEALVRKEPRAEVRTRGPDYMHAAFASKVFGFVDDVEFMADASAGVIHLRSAARLGYYDFGVNRKRAEHLRRRFAAQCGQS